MRRSIVAFVLCQQLNQEPLSALERKTRRHWEERLGDPTTPKYRRMLPEKYRQDRKLLSDTDAEVSEARVSNWLDGVAMVEVLDHAMENQASLDKQPQSEPEILVNLGSGTGQGFRRTDQPLSHIKAARKAGQKVWVIEWTKEGRQFAREEIALALGLSPDSYKVRAMVRRAEAWRFCRQHYKAKGFDFKQVRILIASRLLKHIGKGLDEDERKGRISETIEGMVEVFHTSASRILLTNSHPLPGDTGGFDLDDEWVFQVANAAALTAFGKGLRKLREGTHTSLTERFTSVCLRLEL